MAYSTVSEVASEFKDVEFTATTKVTDTEVLRFIDEAEALINGLVSCKYVVPILTGPSPESFKILRMVEIWLVADRVRQIMQVKDISVTKVQQGTRGPNSKKAAMDLLKKICDGTLKLTDAVLASSSDGVTGFLAGTDFDFTFCRDGDTINKPGQW